MKYAFPRRLCFAYLFLVCGAVGGRANPWISEILFNTPGTNFDVNSQYVELRGTPNQLLSNIFFVAVEGNTNGNPGTVLNVFDLTGVRMGGNGFLVMLQSSNSYIVSADATVLVNTNGPGFGSGSSSSIHHRGKAGQVFFQPASITFFLIQSATPPQPGDDIDSDNDGYPDGAAFDGWVVLDSVGILDHDGVGDIGYGLVNYRRAAGPGAGATVVTGRVIPVLFTPGYVARVKNSTNWLDVDWVAVGRLGGTPPRWLLTPDNTYPAALGRGVLNNLGSPNFRGPRVPGIVVRQQRGITELVEGGPAGRYSVALTVACRNGLLLSVDAPPGLEISIDQGRSYGTNRVLKLAGPAARTVYVRAVNDDIVGPCWRQYWVTHTVIASGDPIHFPTNATLASPAAILVQDDDRVVLSEIDVNPPGTNDAPFEYIELRGTPHALLEHVALLSVNSDSEVNPGVATVFDLSGQRLGSNGLLLVSAPSGPYAGEPGTTMVSAPQLAISEGALHNGSVTFLLVHTTNSIPDGTDLDSGDNGVLEKLPADTTLLDSIGWLNDPHADVPYTDALLAIDSGVPDAVTRFKTDDRPNAAAAWFGGRLAGDAGGSIAYDDTDVTTNFPFGTGLSPGGLNNTAPQISPLPPFSSVIGDPTTPVIRFTISDAEAPLSALALAAHSSNPDVVPDDHLILGGSGAQRTLVINATGVGYATITISISDGVLASDRSFPFAASADVRTHGRFHTGASDGSTAYAIDARWMLIGDDENQRIRLYSRSNSGPPVASFDMTDSLELTDLYDNGTPKEVDIEASTHIGNRIFWMGSHSHSGDAELRTNRARIFTTDLSGTGSNAMLSYVGRYDYLKADLLNWDAHGEHGKGDFYYGLVDSGAAGVDPKATNGSGFNIEGLAMAPRSTNSAYLGFRAPLVPPAERVHALIVPVTNFAALAASTGPPGSARFGAPIELNLGGRGIRSIEGTGTNYLIVAGPPGPATGISPFDFKLFTWTGRPGDAPQQRGADLSGMNPEGIVALPPLPWTSNSNVQLVSDNGTTVLYGDGVEAKHLSVPEFKKCRTDWVQLGPVVTPQPFIRTAVKTDSAAVRITWHSFAGRKYRIQSKAALSDRRWTDLPGTVTATNATSMGTVEVDGTRRFFRVVVVP